MSGEQGWVRPPQDSERARRDMKHAQAQRRRERVARMAIVPADVVDRLYSAFSGVPKPERLSRTHGTARPEGSHPLLEAPLRSLDGPALKAYVNDVHDALRDGSLVEEFMYFTPRLLDLAVQDKAPMGMTLAVLRRMKWWTWPERNAVNDFLFTYWEQILARYPSFPEIDFVLLSLGRGLPDMRPYLARWEQLDSDSSVRHLHELVRDELTVHRGRPRLVSWVRASRQRKQVIDWLLGPAAQAAQRALTRTKDHEIRALLGEVHDRLTRLA